MENFAFTISLADALTGPSKRIQSALAVQQKSLLASSKSALVLEKGIAQLETAMVRSAGKMDFKAYNKQAHELDAMKAAYDRADKSGLIMAKHLAAESTEIGESIKKTKELAETYALVGEAALKVGEWLGEGATKTAEFAIEQVQMKAKLVATLDALGKGPGAGAKTFAMLDELSDKLPQTRDQLGEWSKAYMAMGITDLSKLRAQLNATASAQALMGEEGVSTFNTLSLKIQEAINTSGKLKLADKQLAGLAKTGVNVSDVAEKMGISVQKLQAGLKAGTVNAKAFGDAVNNALVAKGAGPLAKMGMSMETLGAKFKENIGKLFEDVDIEPFVSALHDVVDMFGQGNGAGITLKGTITGLFSGIFSIMGKVIHQSQLLFLGMVILGLRAYIAVKPFLGALKAIGVVLLGAAAGYAIYSAGLGAVAAASWIASGGLTAAAVAGWAALAPVLVAAAPFIAFGAAVMTVWEAFKHWDEIKDVAGNLINGLVSGIESGAGLVWSAIKNLGHGAMKALKGVLGIASRSKEFAKLGMFGGEGLAYGFTRSSGMVSDAVSGVGEQAVRSGGKAIDPKQFSASVNATPSASGGGKGASVVVHVGGIHIDGAGKDSEEITETAVTLVFERVALELGL